MTAPADPVARMRAATEALAAAAMAHRRAPKGETRDVARGAVWRAANNVAKLCAELEAAGHDVLAIEEQANGSRK